MSQTGLSLTEYAVLGVLAEAPSHGFAISRALSADQDLGRILTVRRPLVYRALDRLIENGLARAVHTEKSDAGPKRVVHRVTRSGRRQLARWLTEPVSHVREMRIDFLLKLTLIQRSGLSPARLIDAQRRSLESTLEALDDASPDDHVELWRRHNARAAGAYLEELQRIYR